MMILPQSGTATSFSIEKSTTYSYTDTNKNSIYSRTWKNVVQADGVRKGLRISVPTDKSKWITNDFKADKGFATYLQSTVWHDYTWFIVDDAGNPVDWTGYLAVWDLDSIGKLCVPNECLIEYVGQGKKIKNPVAAPDYSGYTQFQGKDSYTSSTRESDVLDYGISLRLHIPASGMVMHVKGTSSTDHEKIWFGMLTPIIEQNQFPSNPGKWE